MSNQFLEGFLEGLRLTSPFQHLSGQARPTATIWTAHDASLLALRGPVYQKTLRKPALKPAAHDAAIQSGLAVLASFARAVGTRQALVRIDGDQCQAISFQPRPFDCNWTAAHAIAPTDLHHDAKDPLLDGAPLTGIASVVSTRRVVHLAGRVALAIAHRTGDWDPSGQATFEFTNRYERPKARVRWRSRSGASSEAILET